MRKEVTENNFNRLAICIMSKHNCSYEEALDTLAGLKLNLVCGEAIRTSIPLQAALLTALNTGKRAFLGGIFVVLPENIKFLLPWSTRNTLNEVVVGLGGEIKEKVVEGCFTLTFGAPANIDDNSLEIVCNAWQGGILSGDLEPQLQENNSIPIGGIAAGALGVGTAFLRVAGVNNSAGDSSVGVSLWRPDIDWLDPQSRGPEVKFLPEKYWLLGLGHLGQAYLWNIAFLPYENPSQVSVLLQDYDRMAHANLSAGLLCEQKHDGQYKTRVCSDWLEDRGFRTIVTERKFDVTTKPNDGEPLVALCGFDSASSRVHLENAGFDLVIEAALGGNLSLFDNIILHTFPDSFKSPNDIWGGAVSQELEVNSLILEKFAHLEKKECGIIAQTLARKAISTSFVGAFAGALVIAELLRGLNGGIRYDTIVVHLRSIEHKQAIIHDKQKYSIEMSRNGFLPAQVPLLTDSER
ncbi:MAG: hypothetical protein IT233_07515 [Bacteroidia bacterium]|nr:hypothetical protein [Bacteroidia bacterium]